MTNREIAQEISNRIGNSPIPFDSVYSIALQIYNELGGEETQFDSVYSILLEILPLVEGGIAAKVIDDSTISSEKTWSSNKISSELENINVKPIEEVSELPDAAENKDKFFRLNNSEKDVYAAKLLSSETITSNRLPDEQQIDKAYLWLSGDEPYYYKGTYKIICTDGVLEGYGWLETYPDSNEWYFILTKDNAVNVSINSLGCPTSYDDLSSIDEVNKVITTEHSVDYFNFREINNTYKVTPIPATYNAPESAQIGNAYLIEGNNYKYLYDGVTPIKLVVSDGEIDGCYRWDKYGDTDYIMMSTKKASEIYYNDDNDILTDTIIYDLGEYYADGWRFNEAGTILTNTGISLSQLYVVNNDLQSLYIPQLNAPDSEQVGNAYITVNNNNFYYIGTITDDSELTTRYAYKNDELNVIVGWGDTIYENRSAENLYKNDYSEEYVYGLYANGDRTYWGDDYGPVSSYSTVKYQRTETIEEWDWQDIIPTYASDSDIDDLFTEPTPTGNKFYLLKASDEYGTVQNEAFVHTTGDTVNYNGQTCYRWYKQEADGDTLSSDSYWDDNDMYMLTNTLNIHLPFNKYSDEFVAVISNDSPTSYLASFGKDDFVEMIVE